MYTSGGMGILHRFDSIEQNVKDFRECLELGLLSFYFGVSVGVKNEDYKRVEILIKETANIITIDVAHGHHILVKKMIEYIRKNFNKDIIIIAGNIATPDAAADLISWGANIIKCGIGPGSQCKTRRNTGVGVPQLYAIESIKSKYSYVPIIADGGIKNVGDIAKALAKGADGVMVGLILAGTAETPGNVYPNDSTDLVNRTYYKIYGGSSSAQNQGENRFVEGGVQEVPFKGHVKYILKEIKEGLQSSFSYCGARNIKEFREKAKFIEV